MMPSFSGINHSLTNRRLHAYPRQYIVAEGVEVGVALEAMREVVLAKADGYNPRARFLAARALSCSRSSPPLHSFFAPLAAADYTGRREGERIALIRHQLYTQILKSPKFQNKSPKLQPQHNLLK
jgi:hypothetical protein